MTASSLQSPFKVNVGVVGTNGEGSPDVLRCEVFCSKDQYENGDHYDMAKEIAEKQGFEPSIAFDEWDPAWTAIVAPTSGSVAHELGITAYKDGRVLALMLEMDPDSDEARDVSEIAGVRFDVTRSLFAKFQSLQKLCVDQDLSEVRYFAYPDAYLGASTVNSSLAVPEFIMGKNWVRFEGVDHDTGCRMTSTPLDMSVLAAVFESDTPVAELCVLCRNSYGDPFDFYEAIGRDTTNLDDKTVILTATGPVSAADYALYLDRQASRNESIQPKDM